MILIAITMFSIAFWGNNRKIEKIFLLFLKNHRLIITYKLI